MEYIDYGYPTVTAKSKKISLIFWPFRVLLKLKPIKKANQPTTPLPWSPRPLALTEQTGGHLCAAAGAHGCGSPGRSVDDVARQDLGRHDDGADDGARPERGTWRRVFFFGRLSWASLGFLRFCLGFCFWG